MSDYGVTDILRLLALGVAEDQACGHCDGTCSQCAEDATRMIAQVRAEALREAAEEADEWKAAGGMHGGEWFPSEWAGQVAGWLEHRADQIEKESGL